MGHRTTRSVSEQYSEAFACLDQNRPSSNIKEENAAKLKIKAKPGQVELCDWSQSLENTKPQTPINKLLFESQCKENWFQ